MMRVFGENLPLKLVALVISLLVWFYVAPDRNPSISRTVNAEVKPTGVPPPDLIVRLTKRSVALQIRGPRTEVEAVTDNEIKAVVDLSKVRADDISLPILEYRMPAGLHDITYTQAHQTLQADILPKQRKRLQIEPKVSFNSPLGRIYGQPRLDPVWAYVVGATDDVKRVVHLWVYVDTHGGNLRDDVTIHAVDKDELQVDDVTIEPAKTHVEVSLVDAPTTRTLLVSVQHTGHTTWPYNVTDISVIPDQVTVSGRPEALLNLTHVSTTSVSLDGLTHSSTLQVPLMLPDGVVLTAGRPVARVSIKVQDAGKQ